MLIMSRFQRLLAIPVEEYHHLKSLQRTQNPLEDKLQTLSSDYQKHGSIPDAYTRVQRQGETLNEMIEIKDSLRKRLVSMTPKPFQSRAQSLFEFVEDRMKFTDKGEMINSDGTTVEGSNITDLVQHAVRDRRRNIIPEGWSPFLNVLRDSNAPRMLMNYETLEELSSPIKTDLLDKHLKTSKVTQSKIKQEKTESPFIATALKKQNKRQPKKEPKFLSPEIKTRQRKPPKRYDDYKLDSKKYF